jgi:hypothetical protein
MADTVTRLEYEDCSEGQQLDGFVKQAINDEAQNPWKQVIIERLVVQHAFTKEHETDPRKARDDMISWEVAVVLDPQVSSDASELVRQAKREVLLEAASWLDEQLLYEGHGDQLRRMAEEIK